MTRVDAKTETCPCQVCRSDLAYVAPCDYRDAIEFEIIVEGDYDIITDISQLMGED